MCRGRLNWHNHGAQRASIRGAETHTVVRIQTDKNLRCRHAWRRLKHGSCGHHARSGSFRLCVLAPAGQEARRATSGAPPKGAGLQHTHTQATGAGRQKSDIEGGRSPSRGARTGCSNSVGSSRGRANAAGGRRAAQAAQHPLRICGSVPHAAPRLPRRLGVSDPCLASGLRAGGDGALFSSGTGRPAAVIWLSLRPAL